MRINSQVKPVVSTNIIKDKAFKSFDLTEHLIIAYKPIGRCSLDGIRRFESVIRTKFRGLVSNIQGQGNPGKMRIRCQQGVEFENKVILLKKMNVVVSR